MFVSHRSRSAVGQQLTIHHELHSHLGTDEWTDRFIITAELGPERFVVIDPAHLKDVEIDIPKLYGENLLFYAIHAPDPDLRKLVEDRIDGILKWLPKKRLELDAQEEYLRSMKEQLNALPNTLQT